MPRGQNAEDAGAPAPQPGGKRVTPMDIQEKVFRNAFRGYHEREVDEFLDRVTEEMARLFTENKRLREELARRSSAPAAPAVAEAAASAGAGGGPEAAHLSALASGFIAREREFLQTLAGLIQSHAQAVKSDVRSVREMPGSEVAAPSAPSSPAPEGVPATPARPIPSAAPPTPAVTATPAPPTPAVATPIEAPQAAPAATPAAAPTPDDSWAEASATAPAPGPAVTPSVLAGQAPAPSAPGIPGVADAPEPSAVRVEEDPRLVDLTAEDEGDSEEPTQLMQPVASEIASEPPGPGWMEDERRSSAERDPKDHEASLRELFWGED